jgi:hypothetical protein
MSKTFEDLLSVFVRIVTTEISTPVDWGKYTTPRIQYTSATVSWGEK